MARSQSIVLVVALAFVGGLCLNSNSPVAGSLECGINRYIPKEGLVGAKPGKWPHTARIVYKKDNGKHVKLCNAAIIDQDHLVTSSDCITRRPSSGPFYAVFGDHSVLNKTNGYMVGVSNWTSCNSSLAFVTLERHLVFELTNNRSVNAVCLPPEGNLIYQMGTKMYLTGWFQSITTLTSLKLELVDNAKCNVSSDDKLCLEGISLQLGKDFAGSPLVKYRKDRRIELVGIASHQLENSDLAVFIKFDTHCDRVVKPEPAIIKQQQGKLGWLLEVTQDLIEMKLDIIDHLLPPLTN